MVLFLFLEFLFCDAEIGSKNTNERSFKHGSFSFGGKEGINSLNCERINDIDC